ncbi:DUF3116 family protein [Listeria fleischmannii]|uniref:DUF3116 family protein n=1 Tax=Listeria fleischmannii TaxID=1069827 RepID=UPI00162A63D5|nr:DUF3116 family protein [Listeria fleischmannii]MBC1417925.1 DUF3116 family protein [Listeria fleischmannii]
MKKPSQEEIKFTLIFMADPNFNIFILQDEFFTRNPQYKLTLTSFFYTVFWLEQNNYIVRRQYKRLNEKRYGLTKDGQELLKSFGHTEEDSGNGQ